MKAISVNLTGGAANDTVTGTYGRSHNSEFAVDNVTDPSTSLGIIMIFPMVLHHLYK